MTVKNGRPRRFDFGSAAQPADVELTFLLGFLDELAVRVEDQIIHLPPEALNFVGPNSQLSIGRLVLHLVGSEVKQWGHLLDALPAHPHAARFAPGMIGDFTQPPGDLSFVPEVMHDHLGWRRTHLLDQARVPGFLDRLVRDHGFTKTVRELLSHQIWHWSYHSGQIGLVALEAGHDYVWMSTPKS